MSAESFVAYFGVRQEIEPQHLDGLENRTDERLKAARRAGLKVYWGNFSSSHPRYLLFIGAEIALLGREHAFEAVYDDEAFQGLVAETKAKLLAAGIAGAPNLYLQWHADI